MDILKFLLVNWDSVLVVLVLIATIVVLIIKKQYGVLYKIALALVAEAEKQFGGNTGKAKLAAIVEWMYPKIPAVIRLFLSVKQIEGIIESALTEAQEAWKKNENLQAHIGSAN